MKTTLLTAIILWAATSTGQGIEKGNYVGRKLPFTICYFTYSDSIIEVEYFFQKSNQIFGHIPAKKVEITAESSAKKPMFKSSDDSIAVYIKTDHISIIHKELGKVKVYPCSDTSWNVMTMRNRLRL